MYIRIRRALSVLRGLPYPRVPRSLCQYSVIRMCDGREPNCHIMRSTLQDSFPGLGESTDRSRVEAHARLGCARATWFDVSACACLVGALGVVVGVTGRGGCVVHGLPWRVGALHVVTVHAVAGCSEGGMHGLLWSAPRCWLCACYKV